LVKGAAHADAHLHSGGRGKDDGQVRKPTLGRSRSGMFLAVEWRSVATMTLETVAGELPSLSMGHMKLACPPVGESPHSAV